MFGRAYGFAFPASIAGIVAGSLIAAPLAALFGLVATLMVPSGAASCYAGWLLLRRQDRASGATTAASPELALELV